MNHNWSTCSCFTHRMTASEGCVLGNICDFLDERNCCRSVQVSSMQRQCNTSMLIYFWVVFQQLFFVELGLYMTISVTHFDFVL